MIWMIAQILHQPLNIPTTWPALFWAMPVCLSIALVYKALKLEDLRWGVFIREVALLTVTILGFMILTAIGLLGIHWLTRL